MKIYPELDYHFLITASIDERVRRKCIQYNDMEAYEKIKENIMKRDKLQEEAGYYKKYYKTVEIDVTDCKSAEEGAVSLAQFMNICQMDKNEVENLGSAIVDLGKMVA